MTKQTLQFWRVSIGLAWHDLHPARVALSVGAIALGVATLTAILTSTAALDSGLRRHTRELLGGDISLRLFQPATLQQMEALRAIPGPNGVTLESETTSMALSAAAPQPQVVTLKAVDPNLYPFYGTLSATPSLPLAVALDGHSVLIDAALAPLLGIGSGRVINIAGHQFRVSGIIDSDSTRIPLMAPLPEVLISQAEYERTGLTEGTPALYHLLLRLPPNVQPESLRAALERLFPSASILDNREPDPGVLSALAAGRIFLSVTALGALILSTLGVAAAQRTHLLRQMDSVAILKLLGAAPRRILTIHWSQAMMIAVPGSFLGVLLGLAGGLALNHYLGAYFRAADPTGFHAAPLIEGLIAGVATAILSLYRPLVRASRVRPLILLRRGMEEPGSSERPPARYRILRRLTRLPFPPTVRHAIAGLWRPSGGSAGVLLVLMLGTTVLLTTTFLAQSLVHQMSINEVYGSENLYLMNVPRDDRSAVLQFLARELGRAVRLQPYAAFRLMKVNGHPVVGIDAARHRQSWFATSLEGLPPGTAALNPRAAALLDARIGDSVELLAQGQTKRLRIFRIAPLPTVGVLHPDLMLSEDSFQDLHAAEGGAFYFDPARVVALEQRLQRRFPTIAMMNMADVIQTGRRIVAPLSWMIRFQAVFLLLAGLAILELSVAETATLRQREAAIFRVLGAKRQLIFSLYSLEFALIGLEAGVAGSSLAWILCTYLVRYLFPDASLVNGLATAAAFTVVLAVLAAGASWAACFRAVFEKPLVTLRRL